MHSLIVSLTRAERDAWDTLTAEQQDALKREFVRQITGKAWRVAV